MDNEKQTSRIEAFSDGVLAIVVTILVFDLKPPTPGDAPDFNLAAELLKQWPTYLSFLVSFLFVLVMWINHHRLFTIIRRSDDMLPLVNGLLLLGITLFPFPTAIVARYLQHPQAWVAFLIYNSLAIINSLLFNLLWRYAAYKNRLFSPKTDMAIVRAISRQYMYGPLLYIAILIVGLFNGPLSLLCSVGMGIFLRCPTVCLHSLNRARHWTASSPIIENPVRIQTTN